MSTVDEWIQEGISAHRQGDLEEATRCYQQALDLDTTNASAHTQLGYLLGQQQRWPQALDHLRMAVRIDPHLSSAHCNLGQVLTATGAMEEGLHHLEAAVQYDPDNVVAWDCLARIRLLDGQYQPAESAARNALRLRPLEPHLLTRLGSTLVPQHRLNEALGYFQQALQIDRHHADAWTQLGILLYRNQDLTNARQALQNAIAGNDTDTTALRFLALVELNLNNREGAIAQFERLLGLQPEDHQARLDLAVILLSMNRGSAALEHLDQIESPTRDTSKFLFYQATALQQCGHTDAGRILLQQIIADFDDLYADKARKLLFTA